MKTRNIKHAEHIYNTSKHKMNNKENMYKMNTRKIKHNIYTRKKQKNKHT